MFRLLFIGTCFAWAPGLVAAQALTECSKIESTLARLACYDRQAAVESHTEQGKPQWSTTTETDTITDTVRSIISVEAVMPAACNRMKEIPKISIICVNDTWFVRVSDTCTLPFGEKTHKLLTRIDQEPPADEVFSTTTERDDLQISVTSAANLIRRLMTGDTYRLRIVPDNGYPANVEFPVGGLTAALQTSGATCAL